MLNLDDYSYFATLTLAYKNADGIIFYLRDMEEYEHLMDIAIRSDITEFKFEINPEIRAKYEPWEIIL